jgi:site-specific DNA-cytosine methylase
MLDNKPYVAMLPDAPALLQAGPDYTTSSLDEKLAGLSLFSGCGNLDKGLEEGGAVEFNTAVEMCPEAVHTLHANARQPEKLKLWLGSVDDYLKSLLTYKDTQLVAHIGDVAVIAAGSPCPGFSTLQQDWLSTKSLRNASHVTTFCSFVETYRPKYALLENVVNMACTRVGYEEERVLSQIIACLVSMGYQVQQFIMSAWNYGSPQHRSRLILSIAAPGLPLLTPPPVTHSHPKGYRSRTIGDLLNGQKFGAQDEGPAPLPFVSALKATAHLPNIGTGAVKGCIKYPDHRLYRPINLKERTIIKHIPKNPPGQGLAEASKLGLVPHELYANRKEIGQAYKRIKKDGLFPTVITRPSPHDARAGPGVHWAQDRPITIEEARIIQGIPPKEVIIGSTSEQIKQVGNAVDRRVSEQLGLALRRAIEGCSSEALNADRITVTNYTNGFRKRKPLVCVKIPASSRTKHPLELFINTPTIDSEAEDRGVVSRSSSSLSLDSTQSVVLADTSNRTSSPSMIPKQIEARPIDDKDIPNTGASYASSSEEADILVPVEDPLPFSMATAQAGILHGPSRTLSPGVGNLLHSLSPFSIIPVRGKRPYDSSVSLEMIRDTKGPSSCKRAKISNGSRLTAIPSGMPPVEPEESIIDLDATAQHEETAVFVERSNGIEFGKKDLVSATQHSQFAVRLHQPVKLSMPTELRQPAKLSAHAAPRSRAEIHKSDQSHNPRNLPTPTELLWSAKPSATSTPSGSVRSSATSRKTRPSGLSPEPGPTLWSKVPEKEILKAKEMARRGSRPYA